MDDLKLCLYDLESFQTIWKVSGRSKKCPDHPENVAGLSKILQNHLLCAFVADLKIDAIYALYPESFCDKNLAIRKVFAFCDSAFDLKKFLWQAELNPRVRCAFDNVFIIIVFTDVLLSIQQGKLFPPYRQNVSICLFCRGV